MKTHDALGRRFPNNLEPAGTKPTAQKCDLVLFERLDWHGPLPTDHLYYLDRECGRKNRGGLQHRLRILCTETETAHGGRYLDRPKDQYPSLRNGRVPRNYHAVYKLHDGAIKALDVRYNAYPHGGWFEHQLMQSIITAEIEIGTYQNRLYTFKPRHRIIKEANSYPVHLSWKEKGKFFEANTTLRPDAHFAINYGDEKERHYFVEVDRGTEVKEGVSMERKTIERSLRQYREFIGERIYRETIKTDDGAFVLFVFINEQQMRNAMDILLELTEGKGNNYILFRCDERFAGKTFPAPMVSLNNWNGEWLRVKRDPVKITAY